MPHRTVHCLTFHDDYRVAELRFGDGRIEQRECTLWDAASWADQHNLAITTVSGDALRWERREGS